MDPLLKIFEEFGLKESVKDYQKFLDRINDTVPKTCSGLTLKGTKCSNKVTGTNTVCKKHLKSKISEVTKFKCCGIKKDGSQCTAMTEKDKPTGATGYYCFRHVSKWAEYEGAPKEVN
jgi:hypothetical protein